uniref:S8 family peptidase n=1 Tax=Janibacter limosus TaxID=53458 RepID=A0AC61U3J4_9MICO|nr:S8 family peptidase [Janibacter limosus]
MRRARSSRTAASSRARRSAGTTSTTGGTSMAAPHATGVAALIISRYGKVMGTSGFGMKPDTVASVLMDSARNTPCPEPRLYDYPAPIPAGYNAECVGDDDFNGFYGDGIIDARAAVAKKKL